MNKYNNQFSRRWLAIIGAFAAVYSISSSAMTSASQTGCAGVLSNITLISSLDPKLLFLDRCQGLCGITSIMNAVQLALNDIDHTLLTDPFSFINQINQKHPETRGNTSALPSFDKTIELVSRKVEEIYNVQIEHKISALRFPWDNQSSTIHYSQNLTNISLKLQPGERQVFMFMAFNKANDDWIGTHAMTLINYDSQTKIANFSDPNISNTLISFKLNGIELEDDEGTTFELMPLSKEFFEIYEPEFSSASLKVHSVATIRITKK